MTDGGTGREVPRWGGRKRMRTAIGLLAVAAACALVPATAGAATITVSSATDDFGTDLGSCSLREAVQLANLDVMAFGGCTASADEGLDTIVLASGTTYNLTLAGVENLNATGDLDVLGEPIAVQAATAGTAATISAGGVTTDRVFDLAPEGMAIGSATFTDVDITGGSDSAGAGGAGIRAGTAGGTLTITRARISANNAPAGAGGAMRLDNAATTITDSIIENNSADGGGAIFNELGNLTIVRSSINGNTTVGATSSGGGITKTSSGTTSLVNTTLSGNATKANGGAIFSNSGTLNLSNATIAENDADSDDAGTGGDGGGIFLAGGTANVRNSILGDNADNSSAGSVFHDCAGTIVSPGHNLIENAIGCTGTVPGDLTGLDANLASLAIYGGASKTHGLLPGSPAIGAGNPGVPGSGAPACEATDQRGLPRTGGAEPCDVGAFEVQPVGVTVTKDGNGGGSVSSAPAGILCGAACTAPFDEFTEMTLTAVPDAGSTFTGWSGLGCSGTGTCGWTVDASTTAVTATFTDISDPVSLNPVGNRTVVAGQRLTFTVAATDPDPAPAFTFTADPLPPGSSLDPATGAFAWTPTAAQAGSYPVEISVGDGVFSDAEDIVITVTPAPVVTPGSTVTGSRAAAIKRCKRKKGKARKKCKKRARKLPV